MNWPLICVAASIGVLLGLFAFIAHNNAILRGAKEKYIVFQKSLDNKDTAKTDTVILSSTDIEYT